MHTGRIAWRAMKHSEHETLASGVLLLSRTMTCNVHPSMFTLVIMKSAPAESVFGNVVHYISSTSACSDPSIVITRLIAFQDDHCLPSSPCPLTDYSL